MRLLIVEDEPKTARYLRKGLREEGFFADLACDGEQGLALAATADYDLILLDVLLPGRDGWWVLGELARLRRSTPVILLTACSSVEDRVRGLGLGADDYLVKPFAFSELLARVRTVLRRGSDRPTEVIRVGDLEMDLLRQRVSRAGVWIRLTAKEYSLLSLLAERSGRIVSRTLIAETVWDLSFDSGTNVIEVLIRRLRAKVDDPFGCKLIHTERGRGYVLEAR